MPLHLLGKNEVALLHYSHNIHLSLSHPLPDCDSHQQHYVLSTNYLLHKKYLQNIMAESGQAVP
jgi:hypothetical protein